jgi:hypothetical protein
MISYRITVREHETGRVVETEHATGNTERTAAAAKRALVIWLDMQYPPEDYAITVRRETEKVRP